MNKDILISACEFYKNELCNNKNSNFAKYLYSRNLSSETIDFFDIGISLDKYRIVKYLKSKGFTIGEMLDCGVVKQTFNGYEDCMYDRVVIPIKNSYGALVGFSGRTINTTTKCKYLNTKTTKLFNKRDTLFNLNNAKYDIDYINNDYLILVEGYFDVISLYQNGIKNIVCTMGTALTQKQSAIAKMYTKNIAIMYDGDAAGQNAIKKAKNILTYNNINSYNIIIEDNLDPDEYINKFGCEKLKNKISKSINFGE